MAFLGSVDEPDVIVRIDLQSFQDRREVIRNAAALAFDDRAAGPVDQFQIVSALIGYGTLLVLFPGRRRASVKRSLCADLPGDFPVSALDHRSNVMHHV